MIANFYKTTKYGNYRKHELLVTKNIGHILPAKTAVIYKGQMFCVDKLEFDLDTCEYNIYIIRI